MSRTDYTQVVPYSRIVLLRRLMPSKLIASFRSPALRRERAAMFDQREKIVLLIDGANLFAGAKALGFDIDYRKLLEAFRKRAYLLRAKYYCALV
jgi:hypothetical protein